MSDDKKTRGGARVGAGRKKTDDLKTKSYRLPQRIVAWLDKQENATASIIKLIDEKINNENTLNIY